MKKLIAAFVIAGGATMILGAVLLVRPWQPLLPLSCSFRKALIGPALVAQIHNNSNFVHKVVVDVLNPTLAGGFRRIELIPPRGMAEIGWLQGWSLVPGETLRIHEAGFRDYQITVP